METKGLTAATSRLCLDPTCNINTHTHVCTFSLNEVYNTMYVLYTCTRVCVRYL